MMKRKRLQRPNRAARFATRGGVWAIVALAAFATLGCEPEVVTDAWCEKMKETPKGDWSANDAGNFAKHCVFP